MVKNCKYIFKMVDILEHWRLNRVIVRDLIREYKLKNNAVELINFDNFNFLFQYSIRYYDALRETIRQNIVNNEPLFFK